MIFKVMYLKRVYTEPGDDNLDPHHDKGVDSYD